MSNPTTSYDGRLQIDDTVYIEEIGSFVIHHKSDKFNPWDLHRQVGRLVELNFDGTSATVDYGDELGKHVIPVGYLRLNHRHPEGMIKPIASGTVYHNYQSDVEGLSRKDARAFENGDSGINWYLFGDVSEDKLQEYLGYYGIRSSRNTSPYDCTGRIYGSVSVLRHKHRVLVKDHWSRDI
jgi:hypothetical protein